MATVVGGSNLLRAEAMSVRKSNKIAAAFAKDGARGSSTRCLAHISRERDLWRWLRLPFQPYICRIPVLSKDGAKRRTVLQEVSVLLPSAMLRECQRRDALDSDVYGPSGQASVLEFWSLVRIVCALRNWFLVATTLGQPCELFSGKERTGTGCRTTWNYRARNGTAPFL